MGTSLTPLISTIMSTNLYEILGVQADATPEQSMFLFFYRYSPFSHARFQSEKHTRNGRFRHILIVFLPQTRLRQRRGFVRRVPPHFRAKTVD